MGISADQVDEQRQFDELDDLGFTLLSDADRVIGPAFDAERETGPMYRRLTFVIDQDSTVLAAIDDESDMEIHADLALDALRGAPHPTGSTTAGLLDRWRRLSNKLGRRKT